MQIGYAMMTEQTGPRDLVEHVVEAERAGFGISVTSDHYFPWLESQEHAPYAWSVLGAAAQATARIPLMTYVTCPTTRYHPAVVAQKAATCITGAALRGGERPAVGPAGRTAPDRGGRIRQAVLFPGRPARGPRHRHRARAGTHRGLRPKWWPGQIARRPAAVCYDPDREAAVARAHEQFRWALGGRPVNAELPGPSGFEGATRYVTPEEIALWCRWAATDNSRSSPGPRRPCCPP